ncbi:MAG: xylose isomerase-like TIM barrel [Parcubacteria group bacterium Gr01-1014_73]|nr:MAG: xylose isomerase-like TIM barrel [Parcubacteria group bacterium Gr01-1014_73]
MDWIKKENKKISLGIFQGRLSPSKGKGIQFFPFESWENEFSLAKEIGFEEIEFIFDKECYEENPLWSKDGLKKINQLQKKYGVVIHHICADYFMRNPFFRVTAKIKKQNLVVLKRLLKAAAAIGAKNIEIPLVDNSSIKTDGEEKELTDALSQVRPLAKSLGITIGLETDLPPKKFLSLLKRFNSETIKANYDSGNSAALGYNVVEELNTLSPYLANIHIKDRLLHGTTVPLGTGNTNFEKFFRTLKKNKYQGSMILQVARGEDGKEKETLKSYINFIKNLIKKYYINFSPLTR